MVSSRVRSYSVQVDLPAEAFAHLPWAPDEIAQQMRVLWLVEQVRDRRLGHGKASELAGIARADFLRILGRHRVSSFDFDPEELEEEFQAARDLGRR